MLYRLFTENKHKRWICKLIAEQFSGFTIFETVGYWQGKREKGLCIEILTNSPAVGTKINLICKAICGYNQQDCVLVQKLDVQSYLSDLMGIR